MEVKELKTEGLVKEMEVTIQAAEILANLESSLTEKQKSFKMAGFREGHVPMSIVRKHVGAELLAKEIEQKVDESLREIFEARSIRPALQPYVEIKNFDEKGSLVYTVKVEMFPEIPEVDWSQIELEIIKVKVGEEDLAKAHEDVLKNFKNYSQAPAGYAAKKGDAVMIDFIGKVADKEFDGGKGEGIRLELGSNQFIPGFEDQLVGAKVGSKIKVRVVFPKNYNNKDLASKPAVFDVEIKEILKPEAVDTLNDEFAQKMGVENMEKLNELITQKIEADFNGIARLRLKKILFDKIDAVHRFEIPPGMLQIDFDAMWNEILTQRQSNPEAFKGKNEAQIKEEYMGIARRRVRLGLILAETARTNSIEVSEHDLQLAVYSEAMMRPGQEKIVFDFYANKGNLERLKGPILEEKAVDHILEKILKKEVEVTSKEFFDKYANDFNPANLQGELKPIA